MNALSTGSLRYESVLKHHLLTTFSSGQPSPINVMVCVGYLSGWAWMNSALTYAASKRKMSLYATSRSKSQSSAYSVPLRSEMSSRKI